MVTIAGVNLLTLGSYAWDKHQARRGGRRLRESHLHLMALAGGWPGAFVAQRLFHHKTRKASFQRTFWLIVGFYVLLGGVLLTRLLRGHWI